MILASSLPTISSAMDRRGPPAFSQDGALGPYAVERTLHRVERVDPNALEPLEVKRFHLTFPGHPHCTGDRSHRDVPRSHERERVEYRASTRSLSRLQSESVRKIVPTPDSAGGTSRAGQGDAAPRPPCRSASSRGWRGRASPGSRVDRRRWLSIPCPNSRPRSLPDCPPRSAGRRDFGHW